MTKNHESGANGGNTNPNADEWGKLGDVQRGKFVQGPDGKLIPEDEYDAAMEAYEREEYYKTHPGARETDALYARLKEMDANPDRLDNFEGEHQRGANNRNEEYMNLYTGEKGMYAAAPDGSPLNNAKRKEMARMMHDAEDLQTFEEDDRYKDYIARERAKIGSVYKNRDDFHHRVVARLKRLEQRSKQNSTQTSEANPEQQPSKDDNSGETPQLPGPVAGEVPELPGPTKIEIGEINLKTVEQSFAEIKAEDTEKAKERLDNLTPRIAELYARNRRLIVGGKNRTDFEKIRGEYGEIMDQYLRLKTGETFNKEKEKLGERLEQKLDELKADIEAKLTEFSKSEIGGPYKTQEEVDAEKARLVEEANEAVQDWYDKEYGAIKTKINSEFLQGLIEQEQELEKATNHALDNGSICRKVVSKVINNKYLKGALVAAGAVGLAATGTFLAAGLAAGTMSIGLSYTGAGVALGAAKGGLGGFLSSRQDSRVSKVRGFANEEQIASAIEGIDVTSENSGTKNVADWLMNQYGEANKQDRSSNRKRTAVATGIGAALGALASGLRFDKMSTKPHRESEVVGHRPVEYKPQYGAENVDVSPNHGYLQIFEQVGGDPNSAQWDEAFKITQQVAQKYNVTSDMSRGVISPGLPELLPGKPSTWDATSQQFLNDIINEWGAKGCIPIVKTGGDAIMGTVTKTVPTLIKNSFMGYLTRGTAYVAAATTGSMIGEMGRRDGISGNEAPANPVEAPANPVETPANPAEVSSTTAEGLVVPDEQADRIAKSYLDLYNSVGLDDRLEILRTISGNATENASPVTERFMNEYNNMPDNVKERLMQGIIEYFGLATSPQAQPGENGNNGANQTTVNSAPNQPDNAPQPGNNPNRPNQNPGQGEGQNAEEIATIRSEFPDIDERILNFMTDTEANYTTTEEYDNTTAQMAEAWYQSLNDEQRTQIIQFEKVHDNTAIGSKFRQFLKTRPEWFYPTPPSA